MPEELSSTAKATFYKDAYAAADKDPLCLGSYAFTWGGEAGGLGDVVWNATSQWCERLATADAVSEMWTGKTSRKPMSAN